MSTSVLPLTSRHSVTCVIYARLLMDICWFFDRGLLLYQIFAFVEVILSPHAALGGGHTRTPSALGTCRRPPAIRCAWIIEIIEVIKHEVHVFLFLAL